MMWNSSRNVGHTLPRHIKCNGADIWTRRTRNLVNRRSALRIGRCMG